MPTLVIRSIIIYIFVLCVFRIMGKRQIGQMQPFELVLTLIIADLATIPMAESSIPLLHGAIPLLTLLVVHFVITLICRKSDKFNVFVNGKPVIVITPNGIDEKLLKQLNLSIDDLLELIRACGYFSFDEVDYGIVETTGKLNVLAKSEYTPATKSDLKIKLEPSALPVTIINDGKLMPDNLKIAKITKEEVEKLVKDSGQKKIENIFVCTIDKNGKVYIQPRKKQFQIKTVEISKEMNV